MPIYFIFAISIKVLLDIAKAPTCWFIVMEMICFMIFFFLPLYQTSS